MKEGARTEGEGQFHCNRCGHTWDSRTGLYPLACAHCCSCWWDKPRRRKIGGVIPPTLPVPAPMTKAEKALPPPRLLAMWPSRLHDLMQANAWTQKKAANHFGSKWPTLKRVLEGGRPRMRFVRRLKELEAIHERELAAWREYQARNRASLGTLGAEDEIRRTVWRDARERAAAVLRGHLSGPEGGADADGSSPEGPGLALADDPGEAGTGERIQE